MDCGLLLARPADRCGLLLDGAQRGGDARMEGEKEAVGGRRGGRGRVGGAVAFGERERIGRSYS